MKPFRHSKGAFLFALLLALLAPLPVRADVAPPGQPPGTNIVPGDETQVRMVAETVALTVLSTPAANFLGQAKTEAVFMMRNLGAVDETLEVRFPLTFWDNQSDGFGNFPEISDIQIQVNGQTVRTRRLEADFTGGVAFSRAPWAVFNVIFPTGQDVIIKVTYTTNGFGYAPYFALRYVLETGAGWNGTIGSADIIVKLPYEANTQNAMLEEGVGFSTTTPGAQLVGKEIRWHFEDFEPTRENNIEITLLQTSQWRKVLDETANITQNPTDGEAWGRLGKAYKEIVRMSRYFRDDPAGVEMYQLSLRAYEKAVTLLPKDALWHYGFADLLWSHYYLDHFFREVSDLPELVYAVDEIRQALALDPKNQNARDLADSIAREYPWAIRQTETGYDYLLLTVTPTSIPPTATETPLPEPSATPQPTGTLPPAPTAVFVTDTPPTLPPAPPTPVPSAGNPLCGGSALLLPALAGLLWFSSKSKSVHG
jgi:hypothetical protein